MEKTEMKTSHKYLYLALSDIVFVMVIAIVVALLNEIDCGPLFSYADVILLFGIPLYGILNGVLSRIFIKRIWLPNLILFATIWLGLPVFRLDFRFHLLFSASWLVWPGIAVAVSFIFSFITDGILKLIILFKNENEGNKCLKTKRTFFTAFGASICCFVAFFILDIMLFRVERVGFTAMYACFLFPVFIFVYGILSYKTTKRVMFSNLLYLMSCLVFIIVFTGIGMIFQNNMVISSFDLRNMLREMPIVGFITSISIIVSGIVFIVTSFVAKFLTKHSKREAQSRDEDPSDN